MKIVERAGTKIVRMLQRNDPFKTKRCPRPGRCLVCSGSKPGGCRDNGVTYRIICEDDCEFEYTGQTNQNGYTRGERHMQEYRQHYEKSALWKHSANEHNGDQRRFQMEIVDRVRNDATKRQILEAIRMQRIPEEHQMNSKSEWRTTKIPRIQVNSGVRQWFDVMTSDKNGEKRHLMWRQKRRMKTLEWLYIVSNDLTIALNQFT